jgi:hypothetical protein
MVQNSRTGAGTEGKRPASHRTLESSGVLE